MRPNFLIFITDQHRADHLGCYGNPVVKTPNIDALASAGQRFERAYVATPVCMPNRGSIMTGRMPSAHGARSNGIPLPLESVTFADLLAEAGYRTALIGKSHLQNMEDSAAGAAARAATSRDAALPALPGGPPGDGARGCLRAGTAIELAEPRTPAHAAFLRLPGRDPVQPPRRRVLRRLAALAAGGASRTGDSSRTRTRAARLPLRRAAGLAHEPRRVHLSHELHRRADGAVDPQPRRAQRRTSPSR